jgi:Flp pilus assembly pilin Flp
MTSHLIRLLIDDEGQDLVEYTLLTAAVALGTVAAFAAISTAINQAYTSWDTTTQGIWEPQAPAGS